MPQLKYCPLCASALAARTIEGIERQACSVPGCGFVHWDNPVPVVAAVVEYGGQVVLARNARWPRRMFSLITGFLERNETPEEAVVREVKEELGLDSEATHFIGHYPFPAMNQLIVAFSVAGAGEIRTNDEIAETLLVSRAELDTYDFGSLSITAAVVRQWFEHGNGS